MSTTVVLGATVHSLPKNLRKALLSTSRALKAWNTLTPLARNEWICWMTSAKKEDTRDHRVAWGIESLLQGKRRPCCWAGCPHR